MEHHFKKIDTYTSWNNTALVLVLNVLYKVNLI